MQDTPEADRIARTLAENVYVAFSRQATMAAEPLAEQTILARLVEVIEPHVTKTSSDTIVSAVNAALDAWETREAKVRGPRVASVNLADCSVSMRPR
ncbi:hypothetical protein [Methylobacterium nigriterrae]|uniref:hypothetical protein n=1 Tax=Methylobacterium nigriterrae TaxID=3127512 RepID=UPI003013360D